jgi:NAD(P)-dependent dehydrogenase (short-subunit alcohol dehydrogenase family)
MNIQGIGNRGSSMAYSVAKAAGLQLMKNLAFTQGPKIRVNAIVPGLMLTEWVCLLSLLLFFGATNPLERCLPV